MPLIRMIRCFQSVPWNVCVFLWQCIPTNLYKIWCTLLNLDPWQQISCPCRAKEWHVMCSKWGGDIFLSFGKFLNALMTIPYNAACKYCRKPTFQSSAPDSIEFLREVPIGEIGASTLLLGVWDSSQLLSSHVITWKWLTYYCKRAWNPEHGKLKNSWGFALQALQISGRSLGDHLRRAHECPRTSHCLNKTYCRADTTQQASWHRPVCCASFPIFATFWVIICHFRNLDFLYGSLKSQLTRFYCMHCNVYNYRWVWGFVNIG